MNEIHTKIRYVRKKSGGIQIQIESKEYNTKAGAKKGLKTLAKDILRGKYLLLQKAH